MTSKARPTAQILLTLLPDPPKAERDMQQLPHIAQAVVTLRTYFHFLQGRGDVLVSGEGYLCRRAGEARRSPRPNCVVALNLPLAPDIIETEGNGYTIEEIGQPPDFVLEVGSATSGVRDYTVKQDTYAALEVREYWRFDPSGGQHHDVPLAGGTLVAGRYEPIPVTVGADGTHRGYSPALGLELHWYERRLRFYDPVTDGYVPTDREALARQEQAEAERDQIAAQLGQSEARVRELKEELRRQQGR